jgi:hypothetical protein
MQVSIVILRNSFALHSKYFFLLTNFLFVIKENGFFFGVIFQKSPETVPLLLTSNGLAAGRASLGEELAKAVSTVRLVISAKINVYISQYQTPEQNSIPQCKG